MSYKTLITLNGFAPYDDSQFHFEVVEGGALAITSGHGNTDLIGPGFWVAVVTQSGQNPLDHSFLAPQQPDAE